MDLQDCQFAAHFTAMSSPTDTAALTHLVGTIEDIQALLTAESGAWAHRVESAHKSHLAA